MLFLATFFRIGVSMTVSATMPITVVTWYLEMTDPAQLRPRRVNRGDMVLGRVDPPMPVLNRFFYTAVGGDWYWSDRLPWSLARWSEWLCRPELETWVLSVAGVPAGYFELEQQAGGSVEIAYFGLLPAFIGRKLGGHLLTAAIERSWQMGARRVWVHTCSLDHPAALPNYLASGLVVFKEERAEKALPPHPPGPWPGARG